MPRDRSRKVESPPTNAIVASAANVTRRNLRPTGGTQDWQHQAWTFYDTIGELRFAANWIGNALSRVDLTLKRTAPDGEVEDVATGPAVDVLDQLFGGETGQSQMMSAFGIHLTVPGEGYLVGLAGVDAEGQDTEDDTWLVLSTEEVRGRGSTWTVDRGDGNKITLKDEESIVLRIWRSHPRKFAEADSSTRAVLPILREIEQLTMHVAANVDSRLAGAGLLLVPSEMSFASPGAEAPPGEAEVDPFLATLTEAMVTPIRDRGNAAAVVPIVVKAPGAVLGNAKHITFATPLDEQAMALRTEAIRRFALGMDLPPEIVLGQGDTNHWSAWQIDEAALKVHVEPLCELITDALTTKYLRPALEGLGSPDADVFVFADTSNLRLRPDRSVDAIQLYDRLELSGGALRRETGFEDEDAPTDDEVTATLLRKVAMGQTTPDQTQAALDQLGVDLTPPRPLPTPITQQVPRSALPAPPGQRPNPPPGQTPLVPAPTTPPEARRPVPEQQAASLVLAAELLMHRAMERACNRLGKRGRTRKPCTTEQADTALSGAWEQAPLVASRLGIDPVTYAGVLDAHARHALVAGSEVDAQALADDVLTAVRPTLLVVGDG